MPEVLRDAIGKREVWRSLRTDSLTVAVRRSHWLAAAIEQEFEAARARLGLSVDQALLTPLALQDALETAAIAPPTATDHGPSLGSIYDAYMADPTRDWSPRTRCAYETTRRVAVAVLGANTPTRTITRAHCRVLIDTLRWLPRNASKLYPDMSPNEIAAASRTAARADLISPSNVNAHLNSCR